MRRIIPLLSGELAIKDKSDMRVLLKTLAFLAVLCSKTVLALDLTGTCPRVISVDENLISPITGWRITKGNPAHMLSTVQFGSGEGNFDLPNAEQDIGKDGKRRSFQWAIGNGEQWYIVCLYHGTGIRLSQPLPLGLRQCEILQTKKDNMWAVEKTQCN